MQRAPAGKLTMVTKANDTYIFAPRPGELNITPKNTMAFTNLQKMGDTADKLLNYN